MKSKQRLKLFVFILLLFTTGQAIADIVLGVFPRRPVATTHKMFRPFANHLAQTLGERVKLVVPSDFVSFWAAMEKKEYDLVHFNQFHYVKSHLELGYRVIAANEEFGDKKISGLLAVRQDSGIYNLEGLRGKTILFGGGSKAMGSYIAPTYILKKAGMIEGKDYTAEFAKNPPSAMIGTYYRVAAASGTGNVVMRLREVTKRINTKEMKMLATTDPYPQLPWAVAARVPTVKAAKIQKMMVNLHKTEKGRKVLESARVTSFYEVEDSDYDKVREIAEFVLDERY